MDKNVFYNVFWRMGIPTKKGYHSTFLLIIEK